MIISRNLSGIKLTDLMRTCVHGLREIQAYRDGWEGGLHFDGKLPSML